MGGADADSVMQRVACGACGSGSDGGLVEGDQQEGRVDRWWHCLKTGWRTGWWPWVTCAMSTTIRIGLFPRGKSGLELSNFQDESLEKNNHREPNSQPKLVLKAPDDSPEEAREKISGVPITKSACLSKGWPSKAKKKQKQKHHGGSAWKSKKGKTQKPTLEKKTKKNACTQYDGVLN